MKRMLNVAFAIETIHARLNGSSPEVEFQKDNYKNTTYTKKIGGRGMVSAVCQKYNMKEYMAKVLGEQENAKVKDGKQIKLSPDPYSYLFDDVFGFMMADKISLTEEEFEELNEEQKKLYKKEKNKYTCNVTVKRLSRLQMSSLINISNRKCQFDFNICGSEAESLPYKIESYSGIMSGLVNFNIGKVGVFNITDVSSELRDYDEAAAKTLGVRELTREEKLVRIEKVLSALEYMSIQGNQTNHLTDTKPKFVIMGDYSWGNNVFQGLLTKDGVDIEGLKEALEQNEEYRLGNIYIGVNHMFDKEYSENLKGMNEALQDYDYIKISNVHEAFESYLDEIKKNF